MADKMHKKRNINLLPDKGDGVLSQFLSWALNIGRLLVIITETLALSVFIYRFSIDMRLVDLHDKIEAASAIISSFKSGEDTFRDLHVRLTAVRDYDSQSSKTLSILKDVVDMGRGKITFKSLTVNKDSLELEVQASSVGILSSFTTELKNYPEVTSLSVNRVENQTSSAQTIVGISAKLKI
jgi:Tfp pilus assembly protein PilN